MMETIIFAYRMIRSGGTENLIIKLATQMKKNQLDVRCVCEECSSDVREILGEEGIVVDVIPWNGHQDYCEHIDPESQLTFVSFEWDSFLRLFLCKRKNKKTILYMAHPDCIRGNEIEGKDGEYHKDLRVYKKDTLANLIQALTTDAHIVVMDEIVREETGRFFAREFDFNILRISVDVLDKWESIEPYITKRYESKKIITATRAEFPFKGYVLGLVRWMDIFEDDSFTLEIVSYGQQFDLIQKEIDQLSEESKRRIHLHGKLSYDELRSALNESYLFVGMGTSVIDAAELGIPTLPIKPHEYEVKYNSRFDENPYAVCAGEIYPYKDFSRAVYEVLRFDKNEYLEISRRSHESVCSIYNTELIAEKLYRCVGQCKTDTEFRKYDLETIEKNSIEKFKEIASMIGKRSNNRKIAIYGAGMGGRDILFRLKEFGYVVDCFFDKHYANKTFMYNIPIFSVDKINKDKYYLIISLKTWNQGIVNLIEGKGYVETMDYCYPHIDLEKGRGA